MEDLDIFDEMRIGSRCRRAAAVARGTPRPADPAHPRRGQGLLRALRLPGRLDAADLRRGRHEPGRALPLFLLQGSDHRGDLRGRPRRTPSFRVDAAAIPMSSTAWSTAAMAHITPHARERQRAAVCRDVRRIHAQRGGRETLPQEHGAGAEHVRAAISAAPSSAARSIRPSISRRCCPRSWRSAHGMALNDLPAQGVPLDKLEILLRAIGRRHAAADQQAQRRPDRTAILDILDQ